MIIVNGTQLIKLSEHPESAREDLLYQAHSEGRMMVAKLCNVVVLLPVPNNEDEIVYRAAQPIRLEEHTFGELQEKGYSRIWGKNPQTNLDRLPDRLHDAGTGDPFKLEEDYDLKLADIYIEPAPEPAPERTPERTPEPAPERTPEPEPKPLEKLVIPSKYKPEQNYKPTLRLKLVKMVHDELIELIKKRPGGYWNTAEISVNPEEGEPDGIAHDMRKKLVDDVVDDCRDNVGLSPEDFKTKKKDLAKGMLKRDKCKEKLSPAQAREVLEVVLPQSAVHTQFCALLGPARGTSDTSGQLVAVDDLLKVINSADIDFEKVNSGRVETAVKSIVGDRGKGTASYHRALCYVLTNQIKLNERGAKKT